MMHSSQLQLRSRGTVPHILSRRKAWKRHSAHVISKYGTGDVNPQVSGTNERPGGQRISFNVNLGSQPGRSMRSPVSAEVQSQGYVPKPPSIPRMTTQVNNMGAPNTPAGSQIQGQMKPDPFANKNVYNDSVLELTCITFLCKAMASELAKEGQIVEVPTICSYEDDLVRIAKDIAKGRTPEEQAALVRRLLKSSITTPGLDIFRGAMGIGPTQWTAETNALLAAQLFYWLVGEAELMQGPVVVRTSGSDSRARLQQVVSGLQQQILQQKGQAPGPLSWSLDMASGAAGFVSDQLYQQNKTGKAEGLLGWSLAIASGTASVLMDRLNPSFKPPQQPSSIDGQASWPQEGGAYNQWQPEQFNRQTGEPQGYSYGQDMRTGYPQQPQYPPSAYQPGYPTPSAAAPQGSLPTNGLPGPEGEVDERLQWSIVKIKKCRFLEASGCVSICVNQCKTATQDFFNEDVGLPLTMKPNFEDLSCEMIFGQAPPPRELDTAYTQPCFKQHCSALALMQQELYNISPQPCSKLL